MEWFGITFVIANYLMWGLGFAMAARDSKYHKWPLWQSALFVLVWPLGVAYALGSLKVKF